MNGRTRIDDPMLALMMFPLLLWAASVKAVWRAWRYRNLEEMGLMTLERRDEANF